MAASAVALATRVLSPHYLEASQHHWPREMLCAATRTTQALAPLGALSASSITSNETELVFAVGLHPHAVGTCLIIRPTRPSFLAPTIHVARRHRLCPCFAIGIIFDELQIDVPRTVPPRDRALSQCQRIKLARIAAIPHFHRWPIDLEKSCQKSGIPRRRGRHCRLGGRLRRQRCRRWPVGVGTIAQARIARSFSGPNSTAELGETCRKHR